MTSTADTGTLAALVLDGAARYADREGPARIPLLSELIALLEIDWPGTV